MHIKHTDGSFEYVPYFCLPANELNDVIAPSCYSCFDYPNALADLVSPAHDLVFACCLHVTCSCRQPHQVMPALPAADQRPQLALQWKTACQYSKHLSSSGSVSSPATDVGVSRYCR